MPISTPSTHSVIPFTVRRNNELYAAFASLDGFTEVTRIDEKTGEKSTKTTPYTFGQNGKGGGKVRMKIAANLVALRGQYDAFTKERDKVLTRISGGSGSIAKDDTAKITELNRETQEMLDTEIPEPSLAVIDIAELNLDANPLLPMSTVALLYPYVRETASKEE